MEKMNFSRLIYSKSRGFQMVGIEEGEHEELLTMIRKLHKQQMQESIEDAEEIIGEIHCCASRRKGQNGILSNPAVSS